MRKHTFLLLLSLWGASPLCAQEPKGVTPNPQSVNPSRGLGTAIRAVVIGISDYQDPAIPDLKFAHRDAEAFAAFLRSSRGLGSGALDDDHLKVLLNSEATAAQFAIALDWLMENSKEGDHAIIYFSGHGDVEKKTIAQPGYLLGWDAPSRVYMAGGTVNVRDLQDIISTLSVQNKAKVVVITDACRSGKLSGSEINGAQLTGQNLARQFANEVKILSCQPNEYSIEGEQWGGGRGCFSYHLVDGLLGLADRNEDDLVTVGELDRYLEDHVTEEVAPQSQVPMLLGNKTECLAVVNASVLADLQKFKSGQLPIFTATEGKGIEEMILANVDSTVREMYQAFMKAINDKRFFEPAGVGSSGCAEDFYTRLMQVEALAPLRGFIKRIYAATLQDEAQQVMNGWLKDDIYEIALSTKSRLDKYRDYPRYLERAADLLGRQHYMYPVLQARKHFFQGILMALSNKRPDKAWGEKTLANFRQALTWQPDMPQAYYWISYVYANNLVQMDSMQYYAMHAASLAPSWVLPYILTVKNLVAKSRNHFEQAKQYLEKATRIDSSSTVVWATWGFYYFQTGNINEAMRCNDKALKLDSTFFGAQFGLGVILASTGHYSESKEQFKKIIQKDSTADYVYYLLGEISMFMQNYAEAEQYYQKAIALDSTLAVFHRQLGMVYFKTNRTEKARQCFLKSMALNPNFSAAMTGMAYLLLSEGKTDEAIGYVEQAIVKGSKFQQLEQDKNLDSLRALPEWKALMKKYFPDQVKD